MEYIEELHKRISLKEGKGVIEKALVLAYFYGSFSTKTLSRQLLLPIPLVTAIKKECIKLGIWEQKQGIQITERGKRYIEDGCGFSGIDKEKYISLTQNESEQELLIQTLSNQYRELFELRPTVDVTIDQAKCTTETSFRRAILCLQNNSLIGKNVLCVGDDDLVSISLGILLRHIFPTKSYFKTEICVFDMDERYIEYINILSNRYSLPVKCEKIDLKTPLPLPLLNRFDCFFTDPPYTIQGASLFLSRGISALKKECGLNIFFSFGNKAVNETYALQKCFQLHGLVIKEIYHSFNKYEGASLLGHIGQMIVLESTDRMKAVIPTDKESSSSIYTGDNRIKNKNYQCKTCGKVFLTIEDKPYTTIEKLKLSGCPLCGGKSFLQLNNKPSDKPSVVSKALGRHILADFYGCRAKDLNNTEYIQTCMRNAAIKAKATIVQEDFHKFSPWGVSGVIVIQESHLTIHTWPEYSYASVDLFTCGEEVNPWVAFDYLKTMLKCKDVEFSDISRGHLADIQYFQK